ncbi:MAG: NUDIX hydrolase, partial [Pseudomonadota bacterium]
MPNHFVFPGGRTEAMDKTAPAHSELHPIDTQKLLYDMKGKPSVSRARSFAMAAIRETAEETGVMLGHQTGRDTQHTPSVQLGQTASLATASQTGEIDATEPAIWSQFDRHGIQPDLSQLYFFARAITPPG